MAKTVLLGKEKEKQLKEQKKLAKKNNKRKRRSPLRWAKDLVSEMKKVTWPTRKDLISYTLAVIAFVVVMALITGLFDMGLSGLVGLIIAQ